MRYKHPHLKLTLRRNTAVWQGSWCPSDLSDTYLIRVTYAYRRRPVIAVLNPALKLAKGKNKLPHTYMDGQFDICVHEPDDWSSRLLIADTIMPWVSQWLKFYECWQQTGSWEGGGTHPESRSHRAIDLNQQETGNSEKHKELLEQDAEASMGSGGR
jgi:hypothetical protein